MAAAVRLVRASNWEERLALYIDRCSDVAFSWGDHDCVGFAAGAVKAMTGVDLIEDLRGYNSALEAAALLRSLGHGTLRRAVVHYLGEPKHPAFAKRGDVVMRLKALGVCHGRGAWFVGVARGHTGLVHVPIHECSAAWTIPFRVGNE